MLCGMHILPNHLHIGIHPRCIHRAQRIQLCRTSDKYLTRRKLGPSNQGNIRIIPSCRHLYRCSCCRGKGPSRCSHDHKIQTCIGSMVEISSFPLQQLFARTYPSPGHHKVRLFCDSLGIYVVPYVHKIPLQNQLYRYNVYRHLLRR